MLFADLGDARREQTRCSWVGKYPEVRRFKLQAIDADAFIERVPVEQRCYQIEA